MYYIITNIHNYVWYTYRHNINLWEIPKKPPFFLHIIQRPDEHNVLQLPPSVVACSQGHYKVPKTHQCGVIVPKDTCDDVVPKLEFWFTWAFLSRSMLECGHFQRLPLKSVPSHIIFSLSTSASLSSSLLFFPSLSLPSFLVFLIYLKVIEYWQLHMIQIDTLNWLNRSNWGNSFCKVHKKMSWLWEFYFILNIWICLMWNIAY